MLLNKLINQSSQTNGLTSALLLLGLLAGCSAGITQPPQPSTQPIATAAPPLTVEEPVHYGQFSSETLFSLMVAELAASRRQYDTTLANYLHEARQTEDLGIIKRAARFAQYFRRYDDALEMGSLWIVREPNDIEANALLASAFIEKRQPLKALDYAERIILLSPPDDPDFNQRIAITETIANFSRSVDTLTKETLVGRYKELIAQYPKYIPIQVGLSVLYESQQDTAAAYKTIQSAIKQDPSYTPAAIQEIRLLQTSQQQEKAVAKAKALLDKEPDNNRLRLLYARMLTQTDIDSAYEEFRKLAEESPQHLDIQFSLALISLELQKHNEARQRLEDLLQKGYRQDTVNFYLGNLDELDKQPEAALKHYLDVKTGEDYIPAHSRAARIMASQGRIKEAQAHFAQLRASAPDRRPALYGAEADVLEQVDRVAEAIAILSEGINHYPDNTNLRYIRSSLYEKTNQLGLMESDLRHALSVEPENPTTLNALGYFLTSRTDRHAEAFTLIEKAIALRPDDPAIMDSMGWVLFKLGRNEEAIEWLRKAFERFPDPEVAAHLGEVLWVTGNQQEAKSIWQNNLKDNPNDSRIIDTMERLRVNPID